MKTLLIWFLAIVMMPVMANAAALPGIPTAEDTFSVYGNIILDESPAGINTSLSVEDKDGNIVGSTTVAIIGKYVIQNIAASPGEVLVYRITNVGSNFQSFTAPDLENPVNALVRVDLAFTITPVPPVTPPSGGGGGGSFGGSSDSTPPTNTSIVIDGGAASTDSQQVTLSLSADDATHMMISNYSDFRDAFLENYSAGRQWILSDGEGGKVVYVKYRDQYGNESLSVNDNISYSTSGEVLGVKIEDERAAQLAQIEIDARDTYPGIADTILANSGSSRDQEAEQPAYDKYTSMLVDGIDGLDAFDRDAITYFVLYGTVTTKILGAGERAGVINSYKAAFGELPTDYDSWLDVMKIANGRWPGETSATAEAAAKVTFKKIFLREANMDQPNDNAAVTIMAYGLRSASRNLDSEKTGILTFKYIFGYAPSSATDWDAVRAIAYSGAVR